MTSTAMLQALFGFNQATNERLWSIIMEHLTDEQFIQDDSYSRGSIRNQLVHMANAQRYWLRALLNVPGLDEIDPETYPTREAARAICQQADQECLDIVRSLSDADLERIPDRWSQPVWVGLIQVSHHSTDHRAQILRMLHELGAPTLEQNFAIYMENATLMTVRELAGHIAAKRAEWDELLQQVPAGQMNRQLLNGWTIRDAIAITTWKERRLTEIIRTMAGAEVSFSELPEAEQTRILEAGRALAPEALLDQHQAAHRDLLEALREMDDADLNGPTGIPGLPPEERFWKIIAWATWWSYPAFSAPLRRLLREGAPDTAD